MFALPRYVIKDGRIIVEQGEIREETYGKTLHVAPDYDRDIEPDIRNWFEESTRSSGGIIPSSRIHPRSRSDRRE